MNGRPFLHRGGELLHCVAECFRGTSDARGDLEPDEGAEIKMTMTAGGRATYSWSTDGEPVVYDTHGDGEGVTYRGYGKGGMGATLTLLTTGPMAPMVEMQKERLRERVNADGAEAFEVEFLNVAGRRL